MGDREADVYDLFLIAKLGGFQGRKGDGEPGMTVMWNGFQRLVEVAEMYRIMD